MIRTPANTDTTMSDTRSEFDSMLPFVPSVLFVSANPNTMRLLKKMLLRAYAISPMSNSDVDDFG